MSQATTHATVSKSSVQLVFSAKPVEMVLTNTPTFGVCTYPLNHVDVAKNASSRALFRRVVRVAIAWLLLCSVSFGQIKLVESKSETWAGLKNPVINADGTITTGPDSKPILTAKSVRYGFETAIPYKFGQLKAKRVSTGERVTLDKEDGKEVYWFRSGAPEGKYELEYTVFDPEKGIDSDEWVVDHKPISVPQPGPIDPIKPDEPLPDLGKLPAEARKVIVDLVQNMAKDIEAVNADIDAGRVKTVAESSAVTIQRDVATRNKFKADMNKLLEPRLGKDVLPTTAKQTFAEIAAGWRTVK